MNLNLSKRISALLLGVVLATAGCGSESSSVTGVPGTITGTVKKGTTPVAGVVVAPSPAAGASAVTDLNGTYRLSVAPGSYTLTFTGDNLEPATAEATVASGETVKVDQAMVASTLQVTVTLPAALRNGGPAGFDTDVTGITASATLNGEAVASPTITWTIKAEDGISNPPAPATLTATSGATTGFSIVDFETVRAGANAWLNARYRLTTAEDEVDYIQTPPRHQLLSFGPSQVKAMSYKVIAKVQAGSRTATGSAVVSPVTISSGTNNQPLGMMVVGNAPPADTYAWTLQYLPPAAAAGTAWADAPAGVVLQGADTKNPYVIPTVTGVYKLVNGTKELLFRVSTFHGAGYSDTDVGTDGIACADCHSDTHSLAPKFAEWRGSAHANHNWKDPLAEPMPLFEFGLLGLEGPGYSANCISCHTVGYSKVPTAKNNGFDDVAAGSDPAWAFPGTLGAEAWATVENNPGLKHRAGIQCESCHGPLEPTEHGGVGAPGGPFALTYGTVAPASSMSAGVCMQCHDSFTHHDRGALWEASAHSNTELAIDEVGSPTPSASCTRCHVAEGFVRYLDQQQGKGQTANPGNLLNTAGLTPDNVHSTTCQTCHDPHSTELRLVGDTGVVAGMFAVPNAGAGALCIVCHNSRSGVVKQGTYAITSWARLGPHHSAQGDMFAGRNAFFVGNLTAADAPTTLPNLTKHSFMANACADCHVKWVPEDIKAQYGVANTNHTFRSSKQVCSECHAEGIGERIEESITEKMAALNGKVGAILSAKLLQPAGFDTAKGARTDPATGAVLADPSGGVTVLPASVRAITTSTEVGAVIVALNDGTRFQITLDKVFAVGTTTALLTISETNTQTVAKAYFNLLYVSFDGSTGFHNPSFAAKILDGSSAALTGVVIP